MSVTCILREHKSVCGKSDERSEVRMAIGLKMSASILKCGNHAQQVNAANSLSDRALNCSEPQHLRQGSTLELGYLTKVWK